MNDMHFKGGIVFPYAIPDRRLQILDVIWFSHLGCTGICGLVITETPEGKRTIRAGCLQGFSTPENDLIRLADMGARLDADDVAEFLQVYHKKQPVISPEDHPHA